MSLPHLVQHLQSIPILRAQHQHLLFAHPDILPVLNRNFLLCWNRNFSFCCDIPYSRLARKRVTPYAPTRPIATPTTASISPCLTTSFNTSPGRSPIAIRIPISRVRWPTE